MKNAKKIIAVVLAAILVCVAFVGCKKAADSNAPAEEKAQVKLIDIELTEEQYAFGVDKEQPELLDQINKELKAMKDSGELETIFNKYFGDGTPTPITSAVEDSSKDQLVVATNAAFPPFEYTEGDKFLGIDMEIAAAIAEKLGKELVIVHMEFPSVCLSVQQHKCDIAMAALTVNEKRKESVTFSDSYYQASQKLIVPASETKFDECKTANEVLAILQTLDSNVKIGFQNGTTGQTYTTNDGDYAVNNLKVASQGYDNATLAVQDVLNGNINYVITDAAPAETIVKTING